MLLAVNVLNEYENTLSLNAANLDHEINVAARPREETVASSSGSHRPGIDCGCWGVEQVAGVPGKDQFGDRSWRRT